MAILQAFKSNFEQSQVIALTSVNSGLGRLRQEEDCHEFEASQAT